MWPQVLFHYQPTNNTQQLSSSPLTTRPATSATSTTTGTSSQSMTATTSHATKNTVFTQDCSRTTIANLLFDQGSQRLFITQDLASSLALNPNQHEDINISLFGANCNLNRQVGVVTINLLTSNGQAIPLSVLIVPHIATPLQNTANINITSLPHLQNLQLAHPLAVEQKFEISLLVGADHYCDIVGDHIVRGAGGPTAVASKLDYLLLELVQLTNPTS